MLNLAGLNGVKNAMTTPILYPADTSVSVGLPDAPWVAPPDPAGGYYYLTILNAETPTKWERVKVTARVQHPAFYALTIERNIASSTGEAQTFTQGAIVQWSPGAEDMMPRFQAQLMASQQTYSALATARYMSPFGTATYITAPGYWINQTGKALKLSKLAAVQALDSTFAGDDVRVSAEISDRAANASVLRVDIPDGSKGVVYRNTTDSLTVPVDGIVQFRLEKRLGNAITGTFGASYIGVLVEEM